MSRRGKPRPTGELHTHRPHVATTVAVSADGRRAIVTSTPVDAATPGVPSHYSEDIVTARAVEGPDFSYFLGDEGDWAAHGQHDDEPDGIMLVPPASEGIDSELASAKKTKNFERWDNAVGLNF